MIPGQTNRDYRILRPLSPVVAALAYQRTAGPKRYVVIPGITHYGIYGEPREQATRLAIDWFDQQLKP